MSTQIGWKVNNKIIDLHNFIDENDYENIEKVYKNSEDGESILRHSAAHILGEVLKNKYKNVEFAIGPVTENGFYYDILIDETISLNDLESIEKEMKKIINSKQQFQKEYISKKDVYELFKNDSCKILILNKIPEGEKISLYKQGNFLDLCEGPHVLNTSIINDDSFKLIKVSQVNWQGLLLQRIEGVLFYNKKKLDEYLIYVEKQKNIDHRKIGEEMELFKHINVSQGNVFWLPKGKKLFQTICDYLEKIYIKYNYQTVKTPLLFQNDLWKKTGHWDKYKDNMYITQDNHVVKPMNCPGHVEIFKLFNSSYKDLPVRIGEICHVHRKEESGALNGLKRACGFHQDDGHIFCNIEGVNLEIEIFMKMLDEIYKDFGFESYHIVVSTRPENRIGTDERWEISENKLIDWIKENKIQELETKNKTFKVAKGDGAFYGPKIEIQLEDNFKRKWTCGTLQWDDFLPERLDGFYNSAENKKLHPIMLHRAVLGSIERFIAIMLEHYEGHLPLWLCPVQIVIVTISEKFTLYGGQIYKELINNNFNVILDNTDNTFSSKLKRHLLQRIPYVLIIGEKEMENNNLTVRHKNINKTFRLDEFIEEFKKLNNS
jgi:threonyl-tRNA synthetase